MKKTTNAIILLLAFGFLVSCNEQSKNIQKSKRFEVKKYKHGIISKIYSVYTIDKDTLLDGEYRSYFSNGQLQALTSYIDNKEIGIHKQYHDNGKLNWTHEFIDGEFKDGVFINYNRDGLVTIKRNIIGHKYEGEATIYYDNGKVAELLFCKNDKLDHVIYSKDGVGNDLPVGTLKNGTGSRITYHQNGKISEVLIYKDGELKWSAINLDDQGNIRNGGNLSDGKGVRYRYNESGYVDTLEYN